MTEVSAVVPSDGRGRPRVLIEEWLPVRELGIESVRERAVWQDLPPQFGLHVWWARAPLVASAGAILSSILPAWDPELAEQFSAHSELANESAYREWLLTLCGILGDPVAAKNRLDAANAAGIRLQGNVYGYKPAFKNNPSAKHVELLHKVLCFTWGSLPTLLDPTAGGGSIPFESTRYRLPTYANDINSVATTVLKTGIKIPVHYGDQLVKDLQYWGNLLIDRLKTRLVPYFGREFTSDESIVAYIWTRTITCPDTGKPVPLVGDWSLRRAVKGKTAVAVKLITHTSTGEELDELAYKIVEGDEIDFDPKVEATYRRGKALSPWTNRTITGDYIRAEARAGRMGDVLYAVAVRTAQGRGFRAPTSADLEALISAEVELERTAAEWRTNDVIPNEAIPEGLKTREPHNYGMPHWSDMFTPRQLLVHGCFVEEYRKLVDEVNAELQKEHADALLGMLVMMQGKAVGYNSRMCGWDVTAQKMGHTFTLHAFPFKSTFAESDASMKLYQWSHEQLIRAYRGLVELLDVTDNNQFTSSISQELERPQISISASNGGNLAHILTGSISSVVIDPPYFDNVMYAELSDFFYVWEKRTLGQIWPDLFSGELTNKRDEAVANPARFASAGRDKAKVANDDYEAKMAAIFNECHRVLRDDGVLTVMFTHKSANAWDGLGSALLQAGFTIETSWPVNTQPSASLHHAQKNSAESTIFLACRKRPPRQVGGRVYLSGIEAEVRAAAGEALRRSAEQGLTGVDLLLSTYGPALSVLSQAWPVHSTETTADGTSRLLYPEEALDVARDEVVRLMTNRLVGREVSFDPYTDFVLIAWSVFGARTFPFDDARRLALATGGLDIDELKRAKLLAAKSGNVTLREPTDRLAQGDGPGVKRDRHHFERLIDAVHTMCYIVHHDGAAAARHWADERGLAADDTFIACLQGLVNAIPRIRKDGKFNVTEAALLDRIVTTCYPDLIEAPEDPVQYEDQRLDLQ